MPWSTSELADLAGTTVNTIRHYHGISLLPEPERRYNGYKQYGVQHLVRLLRIRRLADLGVPLSEVDPVGTDRASMPEVIKKVNSELSAQIARLQEARTQIAAILHDNAPADVPAGFTAVASRLSESDRSIIHVYARLYDQKAMADLRRMIEVDTEAGAVANEIHQLPENADEAIRKQLAQRLAPTLAQNLIEYPWLSNPTGHLSKGTRVTRQVFNEAIQEFYNSAQIDVFARAAVLAQDILRPSRRAEEDTPVPPPADVLQPI